MIALGIRDQQNGGSSPLINKLADEWLAANKPQFDQRVAVASKVH
ncbi:hypothetical protein [Caballeronia sordidicola]|uniref:Uncharacterized protein n=1 Tax=Caballeronia sordidicola TaxID=196367 RepID=A0A242MYB1_CABSO|nr:hypothetical protein PAMC26577_11035 [Caballeronia sordidicola]